MRPAGPLPGTNCNSIPRSQARRRTAAEASGYSRLRRGAAPGRIPSSASLSSAPSPAVREKEISVASPLAFFAVPGRVLARGVVSLSRTAGEREPAAEGGGGGGGAGV